MCKFKKANQVSYNDLIQQTHSLNSSVVGKSICIFSNSKSCDHYDCIHDCELFFIKSGGRNEMAICTNPILPGALFIEFGWATDRLSAWQEQVKNLLFVCSVFRFWGINTSHSVPEGDQLHHQNDEWPFRVLGLLRRYLHFQPFLRLQTIELSFERPLAPLSWWIESTGFVACVQISYDNDFIWIIIMIAHTRNDEFAQSLSACLV